VELHFLVFGGQRGDRLYELGIGDRLGNSAEVREGYREDQFCEVTDR